MIYRVSITNRLELYDLSKDLKNGKAKQLSFSGTTSKQLLQYLDVNLKMYTPETVVIDAGINDVLNDKSQRNTENLFNNMKYIVNKCRKFGVKKYIKICFYLYYKSIFRNVRQNP